MSKDIKNVNNVRDREGDVSYSTGMFKMAVRVRGRYEIGA